MSVEMATEAPIIYASPEQRRARALLNNSLLERALARVSVFSLGETMEYVSGNTRLLRRLSESLDFSGVSELSPQQTSAYNAITDPRNIEKAMPAIAFELNRREANFQKRCGKVYGHLGVRSREHALVFRAAHEFANAQNLALSLEVV